MKERKEKDKIKINVSHPEPKRERRIPPVGVRFCAAKLTAKEPVPFKECTLPLS